MPGFLSVFLEPVTSHKYWREHVFLYQARLGTHLYQGVALVLLAYVCVNAGKH